MKTFTILGKLVSANNIPLKGLRVEAWDEDLVCDDLLGNAVSDNQGKFKITFDDSMFKELFADSCPDIFFKIWDNDCELYSTRRDVIVNADTKTTVKIRLPKDVSIPDECLCHDDDQGNGGNGGDDHCDDPGGGQDNKNFRIAGTIKTAVGKPLDAKILAMKVGFNGEELITETQADRGSFEFIISKDKAPVDVRLLVEMQDTLIATSDVYFNLQSDLWVDLVAGNKDYIGPSEFKLLDRKLQPHLRDGFSLTVWNIEFLANKTQSSELHVRYYSRARKFEEETEIPMQLFYACFRQNLPMTLSDLAKVVEEDITQAILRSIDENIIGQEWSDLAAEMKNKLEQHVVKQILVGNSYSDKATLNDIFELLNIGPDHASQIMQRYVQYKDNHKAFWDGLRADADLSIYADDLDKALRIAALSQHHMPAIRVIFQDPGVQQMNGIHGLAKWNSSEWINIVQQIGSAPDTIPGTGNEQLSNYAEFMESTLKRVFPTTRLLTDLTNSPRYADSEIGTFLNLRPDFQFGRDNIADAVAQLGDEIRDTDKLTNELYRLKRLDSVAPKDSRVEVTTALDGSFESARDITLLGKTAFMRRFGNGMGGEEIASKVYAKAQQIAATTLNLAVQYRESQSGILPYVMKNDGSNEEVSAEANNKSIKLNSKSSQKSDVPTLEELFGNLNFCACKHCRSVYSPAAYLVDLLQFLKAQYIIDVDSSTSDEIVYKGDPENPDSAFEEFVKRRSDILNIRLDCENSNTVMPYIDLVNEVLENAVLTITGNAGAIDEAYQTEATTQELSTAPEHINTLAYDELEKAVYPFTAPFSLWNAEGEVYISHFGYKRAELLRALRINDDASDELLQIQLGISNNAYTLITSDSTAGVVSVAGEDYDPWQLWGIDTEDVEISPTETVKWHTYLSNVEIFDNKLNISYEELRQLLQISYIHNGSNIEAIFSELAPCSTSDAMILQETAPDSGTYTELDTDFFDRVQRFMRLYHKSQWTILEFGKFLDVLEVTNISTTTISQLAVVKHTMEALDVSADEAISWWGNMSTFVDENDSAYRSFYAEHFLNKAVFDAEDLAATDFVFALNDEGTDVKVTTNNLVDFTKEIGAALQLDNSDLLLLMEEEASDLVSLETLSSLFRKASISRNLDLSIEELLLAQRFVEANPFDKSNPYQLVDFIEKVQWIHNSSFDIIELQYLLLDEYNSTDGIAPSEDDVITLLLNLQEGLVKIESDLTEPINDDGSFSSPIKELALARLELFAEESDVDDIEIILDKDLATETITTDDINLLESVLGDYFATHPVFGTADKFVYYFSAAPATGYPDMRVIENRYVAIFNLLNDYMIESQSKALVYETMSSDLSVEQETIESLMDVHMPALATTGTLINDFLTDDFRNADVAADSFDALTDFEDQYDAYIELFKAAMYVNRFGIETEEVSSVFGATAIDGWLTPGALSGDENELFTQWLRMQEFFDMRSQYAGGDLSFFDLITLAGDATWSEATEYDSAIDDLIAASGGEWVTDDKPLLRILNMLSEITDWQINDLYFLASSEGYKADLVSEFGTVQTAFAGDEIYVQLHGILTILSKIGASAEDVWQWDIVDLSSENSGHIRQAAKSKYSQTEWYNIAPDLRDVLREAQRDALSDFLVHKDDQFEDENDLYSYYLLDTETSACTKTSRIKLANSTLQLFIQRCQMNLEEEVVDVDGDRWDVIKMYRVWEANRKVFLYPENWIEPELRQSKTEFFQQAEDALLQNDVNEDTVEATFSTYLESLEKVSNIEVVGQYFDNIDEDTTEIHVVGRTAGTPKEYYYRKYVDGVKNYWTPWERLDIDIQESHVMPRVIDGRLYMFWLEFRPVSESINDWIVTESSSSAFTAYEIRLAYSFQNNANWSPKVTSDQNLYSNRNVEIFRFFFNESVPDAMANISCRSKSYSDRIVFTVTHQIEEDGTTIWMDQGDFQFNKSRRYIEAFPRTETPYERLWDVDEWNLSSVLDLIALVNGLLSYRLSEPTGTNAEFNFLKEQGSAKLNLEGSDVLDVTPGNFQLTMKHQYEQFEADSMFFYGDKYRNFFVLPSVIPQGWHGAYDDIRDIQDHTGKDYGSDLNYVLEEDYIGIGLYEETIFTDLDDLKLLDQSNDIPTELPPIQIRAKANEPVQLDAKEQKAREVDDVIVFDGNLYKDEPADPWDTFAVPQQMEEIYLDGYRFYHFYHPFIGKYIESLNIDGLDEVLKREVQLEIEDYFSATYSPTDLVNRNYPIKEVDLSTSGALSIYNWELFFHIPMLIADKLNRNQQYEEAQQWYHYVFNPTDRSNEATPNKFWQFKKFFELYEEGENGMEDSIYNLMYALSSDLPEYADKKAEVEAQIDAWMENPFDPHAIAALRPAAYMKNTVMKYIDNLLDWGDYKFSQDTIETINEATQLYILAAQILGKRPEIIDSDTVTERSYSELIAEVGELDSFSNALIELENLYLSSGAEPTEGGDTTLPALYFCIPDNPNLLEYWDRVEDRLFKIRHCMNIEGVVRQLPLFQPPIDPALLVKAFAQGISIGSIINDLYAPLPHYRFVATHTKALSFCSDVKALGSAMQVALEKRDAEELALLRSEHEEKLFAATIDIRKLSLEEAEENLKALEYSKKITESRLDYYSNLEKVSTKEKLQLMKLQGAHIMASVGQGYDIAAAATRPIPETKIGSPLTMGATWGGANIAGVLNIYGSVYRFISSIESYHANKASIQAGHDRRWDEWKHQEKQASLELDNIDQQITASQVRVAMLEKEVKNAEMQLENSREVADFMTSKFSNKELYDWMVGQLSTLYFQSYQLAYEMAKKAQKSYQYEMGTSQTFVEFGYWDSLRKGLLAGDKIQYDLRRMEMAYFENNKRHYEITKAFSLAALDGLSLMSLKETGSCYIHIPEALFDLDYPGQYMRRIKSVQVTIPCVTGPHTNLNGKLTLMENKWRKDMTDSAGNYAEVASDERFEYSTGGKVSIATSSGQSDSGLFQMNFQDERYLPFEGAGAISVWKFELPETFRSFDYSSISDLILSMNYTAKDGGDAFKTDVESALLDGVSAAMLSESETETGLYASIDLGRDYPNEWYQFLRPSEDETEHTMDFEIDSKQLFHFTQSEDINVSLKDVKAFVILDEALDSESMTIDLQTGSKVVQFELSSDIDFGNQLHGQIKDPADVGYDTSIESTLQSWTLTIDKTNWPDDLLDGDELQLSKIKTVLFVVNYSVS